MHHLCDKPLEESKEDQAYVLKEGAAFFDGLVARMREFQVVIAQLPVRSNDKAEGDRLVAAQKAGKLRAVVKDEMAECGKPESERMGPLPRDAI